MISGNLSIMYGYKGPNIALVSACSTGTHCIGDAGRLIEYGDADIMIAGGAECTVSPSDSVAFVRPVRYQHVMMIHRRQADPGIRTAMVLCWARGWRLGARRVRARQGARRQNLL